MAGSNYFMSFPAEHAVHRCHHMISGLSRIDAIFFEPNRKSIFITKSVKSSAAPHTETTPYDGQPERINNLRSDSKKIYWLTTSEIPQQELGIQRQETLTTENQKDQENLLARVKNPYDGKFDLFFFYGVFDLTAFGISSGAEVNISQGDVIARLVQRSIVQTYEEHKELQFFKSRSRKNLEALNDRLDLQQKANMEQVYLKGK